jgi:hypothetical protein
LGGIGCPEAAKITKLALIPGIEFVQRRRLIKFTYSNSAFLKKILKISAFLLLFIAALLVIVGMLLRTDWAQNLLVKQAAARLSKSLHTKVEVRRVSFSLFNRAYMEGTLVEDQHKDTLLYAGAVKVAITDWFFLKNQAELEYIGLQNAVVNLKRSDSVWNYQFIADFFSGPKKTDTTGTAIEFLLKRAELEKVRILKQDGWVGEDMTVRLGYLDLRADEINFAKKRIFIESLQVDAPYFAIYNYKGNRIIKPPKKPGPVLAPGELKWNTDDWDILVQQLTLTNGTFKNDLQTERKPFPWFDGNHLEFAGIDAEMKNLSWQKDTISAKIIMSTTERSGFRVNRLTADFTFHPEAMIFKNLDLVTPHSRLGNYYAMRYQDFNADMGDFMEKVRLEGKFTNSTLHAADIAYFAPELKDQDKKITLKGNASGTIADLTARDVTLQYGKDTYFNGDVRMTGLPDINNTLITLKTNNLRTTYADVLRLAPEIRKMEQVDLEALRYLQFRGTYKGYFRDFSAQGTLETALGTLTSDVYLKMPAGRQPSYSGRIQTAGFSLGTFLKNEKIGNIKFDGKVNGQGFNPQTGTADINGTVRSFEWNNYLYSNVTLDGKLKNKEFTGAAFVDDPNVIATLNGSLNLSGEQPEFNILVDIQRGNLREVNIAKEEMSVIGKFRLNFRGKTIDDFLGEASLFDVALTKNQQVYVFDTLYLYSMKEDDRKQIEITNEDIHISLKGIFTIRELPQTLNAYLSKYYPLYFNTPVNPIRSQDFTFTAELNNVDQYLPLIDRKLRGLDKTSINGSINTINKSFLLNARVPYLAYGKYEINDFYLEGTGDLDSFIVSSSAGFITVNDSLTFPSTALSIKSSGNVSDVNLSTSANQAINAASLSVRLTNLKDGIQIHFNPSTIVLNDKTWRIEKDGELLISKAMLDARDVRMTNGDQEILVYTVPSEIGNTHDIAISLKKVNLGDLLPFVMKEPKIEGITSGDITIEDPYKNLKIYLNAQTDQTRFEDDSIGITTLNAFWDNTRKKANFFLESNNLNYIFNAKGNVDLLDSTNQTINTSFDIGDTRLSMLKKYVGIVFSEITGSAQGKLEITGNLKEPDLTGSIRIKDGGVRVAYTQCFYKLEDPEIKFSPDLIDFGNIPITDAYGNQGMISGKLAHHFFRDFSYNFRANSQKMLLLNTNKFDNPLFYGKATGRVNFLFSGPEENMQMYVNGEPIDSSTINIVTSGTSKESGDVDYIVWRQYGREMNLDSLAKPSSNLSIDLDFTANPLLKMNVVLDELTGDVISATGAGNMKIHTGTNEALSLNGRYVIEHGNYNFNFQDIFKKPFTLEPGSGSYISWTGDPYNAEININANYIAEDVRMSTLFEDPNASTISGVSSDVLNELSDVLVVCKLTGTLSQPNPSFQIMLPASSAIKNNTTVDTRIKAINREPLEASKQATYLIVFRSFAPQAALVATEMNNELINSTISGVITSILSSSVQGFFAKLFGSSVDVNFNYSRVLTDITGTGTGATGSQSNWRENVSFEFIKSMMNNKLVVTFGSDFNFTTSGTAAVNSSQSFLFLPEVNVEYKITPDGKLRTSFFYRSTYDALSSSGRRDRTGGNISYRTEFDHLFWWKKDKKKEEEPVTDTSTTLLFKN